MTDDEATRRVLSGKELARELRKQAYRRGKERRATDPRYLAMKEAARKQRKEAYQRVKEQRKAQAAEEKSRLKRETDERKARERASKDQELMRALGVREKRNVTLAGPPARQPAEDPDAGVLPLFALFSKGGSSALN